MSEEIRHLEGQALLSWDDEDDVDFGERGREDEIKLNR